MSEKLIKKQFNGRLRFRGSRSPEVSCKSCIHNRSLSCHHPQRSRPIKLSISEFGISWPVASESVCDGAFLPLLPGAEVLTLGPKEAVILRSQRGTVLHGRADCPYVVFEGNIKGEVWKRDTSQWNSPFPYDLCEMPGCCDSLELKASRWDGYQSRCGLNYEMST